MEPLTAAEACRCFLRTANRPDLAAEIGTNKVGNPMRRSAAYSARDALLVAEGYGVAYGADQAWIEATALAFMDDVPGRPEYLDKHWSPARQAWHTEYDPAEWGNYVPDFNIG